MVVVVRAAVVGVLGGGADRAECSAALGSKVDREGECEASREVEMSFGFHCHHCPTIAANSVAPGVRSGHTRCIIRWRGVGSMEPWRVKHGPGGKDGFDARDDLI